MGDGIKTICIMLYSRWNRYILTVKGIKSTKLCLLNTHFFVT